MSNEGRFNAGAFTSPDAGIEAIAAIKNMLAAFNPPEGDLNAGLALRAFVMNVNSSHAYALVAIAAATISWASQETGRSETEIVESIAENYTTDE